MSSKNLTLADACIAIVDCEHKTAPIDPGGQYFAVGTPAMRGNRIDYGEARRVSEETFKAWTRRLTPRPGDLLFAREAPVGPVVRIPETLNVAPGQRTVLLRPDPLSVESDYLFYLLTSPVQQVRLLQKAEGSTVPHLNVADVRSFELPPLPPLDTQKGIAAALRALDDKIESNRRVIVSISDLLDAQSEKSGADLPTVPLGVIATSVKDTVNPSKLGDAVVDHFSLPAFDSKARPERVVASTIKSNKLKVPQRAILLSRLNPRFNRTWWASVCSETSALASTEFLVLTSEDDLELAAAWLAVRDPFFREELPRRVTGTSGSHQRVRPDDVLSIEVPDFRSAAAEVKQSTLALLMRAESLRGESDHLTALRKTLLPELLSGRIPVPAEGAAA